MKKVLFIFSLGLTLFTNAQNNNCSSILLEDDFSNLGSWNSAGTGLVNVANGAIHFDSPAGGTEDRMYHQLAAVASDTNWSAKFDFHINAANNSGSGQQIKLISLSAGILDIGYFSNGLFVESNQDAISLNGASVSQYSNDISTCRIYVETKKGNIRTQYLVDTISLNSGILDYYFEMERVANDTIVVSLYTNESRTQHILGSPKTVAINPSITGLNYVQMGTYIPAYYTRTIDATLDNLLICEKGNNTNSIKSLNKVEFGISNPLSDKLIIKMSENISDANISVFDLNGKLVHIVEKFSGTDFETNVSKLEKGTYVLRIENDKLNHISKFIKL